MKRTCIALLLAALGCVGCCGTGDKCRNADEKKERVKTGWNPETGHFEDAPAHLTPERVHGGIY